MKGVAVTNSDVTVAQAVPQPPVTGVERLWACWELRAAAVVLTWLVLEPDEQAVPTIATAINTTKTRFILQVLTTANEHGINI